MTENDDFHEADMAFGLAFATVYACATEGQPVTDEVEEAVDRMFDLAFQQADPSMLAMCMSTCFDHFIEQKRSPPWAALEHINDAFLRWQKPDAPSLDAAFGVTQDGPGARSLWRDRMNKRVHCMWMDLLTEEGPKKLSIDAAAWVVEEVFHAKDMKRAYTKHRNKVKSTKSE